MSAGHERGSAIVIGGGIGGLTAALNLQMRGVKVAVYEQAPQLGEVGAGITLSKGTQRGLEQLGLLDAVRRLASVNASVPFLHYRTGALLAGAYDLSDGTADVPGIVARHIHRADLHGVLAAAFTQRAPDAMHLARRLVGIETDGVRPVAVFQTGEKVSADVIIGADGLKSVVRSALWGVQEPRYTGQVAWRCLIPGVTAAPYMGAGRAAVFMGPDMVLNRYTLRRGEVVNCVAIARTADWREDGWSTPGNPDDLAALFADWHDDVSGLLRLAPRDHLVKWGLLERDPLPKWRQGRVTLLGDSAHPMLPFLGLGAAMAVEDAVILGRAVEQESDWDAALELYERARRPRTAEVYRQSQRQGELIQSRDPDNFNAAAAPNADPRFYDYDPVLAPLETGAD